MIFYCGLMVHITDTRAQKVVNAASHFLLLVCRDHLLNCDPNATDSSVAFNMTTLLDCTFFFRSLILQKIKLHVSF